MIETHQLRRVAGQHVIGTGGERIGRIGTVYAAVDGASGTFATVATSRFGGESLVPLQDAELRGDGVVVPYSKEQVRRAPRVGSGDSLTDSAERQLLEHYGLAGPQASSEPQAPGSAAEAPPAQLGSDGAMTRSEERLHVGTERVETGRARLRKYVVSETVTRTVPVTHEELRIAREPVPADAGLAAPSGLSEEVYELVLTAERPVVRKEVVPVERVRLDTVTVTEQETVTEEVRKEQIEVDGDVTEAAPHDAATTAALDLGPRH